MAKFEIARFFDFLSSESSCECCGTPCKTALCASCRDDLDAMINANDNSDLSIKDKQLEESHLKTETAL